LESVKARGHLIDLGIGGKIIFKFKFKKMYMRGKTRFTYRDR
jgi:hypothetical protein